jgi:hypothetical protein
MAAESGIDVHHGASRCLLKGSSTRQPEAPPTGESSTQRPSVGASRSVGFPEDLSALIEGSTREIPAAEHPRLHQDASDFVRWGRRGA